MRSMEEEESMVLPVAGIGTAARTFRRFPRHALPCAKIPDSMNSPSHSNGTSAEASFRRLLLAWYDAQARDLPWRKDRDPYRVWVSEIMLQQTRVAAVIEHYHAFLRRFPTVEKLAAAVPGGREACSGEGKLGARNLERVGILPAGAHDACGRKGDRPRVGAGV